MSKNEEVGFASALRADGDVARADMRIEVVKRELSQGALAGLGSEITGYAARLILTALDSYDEAALAAEYRRGFEAGEINGLLLAVGTAGGGQPNASDLGSVETQKGNTDAGD